MNNLETKIGDSVTKIDASPLVCQACGAELVTDFISEIQSARVLVRCGGCGVIIGSGIDENAPVDKRARWSLWLGISSVLLLFLTGIPAVYLGIRSLLRMRYTSFRLQDRYAAIAGTTLGSIFGVCGGFCGVFSLVVALALFFSQKTTFNFEQSMVVLSGIAKVEMPEGINQGVAVSAVNTHQFHFRDAKKKEDATCRIQLVYYPPVMVGGAATLKPTLRLNQINNDARYKTLGETQLNWEIAGKATNVSKYKMEETYRDDSGDDVKNEVIQYVGLVNVEAGIYGLSCSFRTPNKIFPDEASVEAFFKSVTPPDHLHPTEAWKKAKEIKVSENPADDDEETETE